MKNLAIIISAIMLLAPFTMATNLTGAIFFSTDQTGAATVVSWWDTLGFGETAVHSFNMYLTDTANPTPGSFFNSGDSATTHINHALQTGANTLHFFGDRALSFQNDSRFRTLNLFFDGDNTNPGISAVYDRDTGTFTSAVGSPSRRLNNVADVASGGLTFISGGQVITLTALNVDLVGNFVSRFSEFAGDASSDVHTTFTLSVAVPEPSSLILAFVALGCCFGYWQVRS